MALLGPGGCGKSALVAAVAAQLGYQVVEVGPGGPRSEAAVRAWGQGGRGSAGSGLHGGGGVPVHASCCCT
jgi:hypothetical protein